MASSEKLYQTMISGVRNRQPKFEGGGRRASGDEPMWLPDAADPTERRRFQQGLGQPLDFRGPSTVFTGNFKSQKSTHQGTGPAYTLHARQLIPPLVE